jgi:hypothetical protein
MNTPFNKSFCGKSPLNELTAKQEANLPEALKTAIEAKSPTNYGSPLEKEIDPKLAVKMAEKTKQLGKYRDYVEKKEKGYTDPEDGFIKGDPSKTVSFDRYVMSKEIAKGGKSGSKAVKHFYKNKPQYSGYLSEDKRQGVKKGLNIK